MSDRLLRLLLRSAAIAIVVAALVDPVFTRESTERAIVAVQHAEDASSAIAANVRRALGDRFDVVEGPFPAAAATVVIGPRNVQTDVPSQGPVFAVVDTTDASALFVEPLLVPVIAALDASFRVDVGVGVPASYRGAVAVSVVHAGVTLDSLAVVVTDERPYLDTTLTIVPTTPGLWPLRLRAALDTGAVAEHDIYVDVIDQRSAVLFFDRRPSYQSTFVRRAVEADARFRVTHRVITSRDVSRGAGAPPVTLADAAALEVYDVIVVGAPDALTAADQSALERFLRERGGAVVLLLDSLSNAAPLRALTGVSSWREARGVAVPSSLPAGASPMPMVPAVWRSSVGAGQLYVSGLLDHWRYRDEPGVEFNKFWTAAIAEAASTAVLPIEPIGVRQLVTAGRVMPLSFWIRDGSTASAMPQVMIVSDSGRRVDTLPVIAGPEPELFFALWRAPSDPGPIEMQFTSGLATHRRPGLVLREIKRQGYTNPERRARWIEASGGVEVSPDDIEFLPGAITRAIGSPTQQVPWYPMRSPWWIVPFALLLGAEWWLRRRQALP